LIIQAVLAVAARGLSAVIRKYDGARGMLFYHPIMGAGVSQISGKRVSKLDAAIGVALSAIAVFQVGGGDTNNARQAGAAAAVMVLLMTAPVIWRRRSPVWVSAVLAVGAIVNVVVIGDMVRCAAALPALLVCAYAIGRYPVQPRWAAAIAGLSFLLVSAGVQGFTDPELDRSPHGTGLAESALVLFFFFAVGSVIESRTRLGRELDRRNDQLRRQRERRAELAVAADRAQIADGLQSQLQTYIGEMRRAAVTARGALDEGQSLQAAAAAFQAIHWRGRETLTQMRRVVGTLLENLPPEPQPSLSQLDGLLEQAGPGDVRLHVSGRPRVLPAGIEVSAYRTVESLLEAFGTNAGQRIDVNVDFAAEALIITVHGAAQEPGVIQSALASVQARVALLKGSMTSTSPDGLWMARVTLPLSADA
jgi:hypothetical protein